MIATLFEIVLYIVQSLLAIVWWIAGYLFWVFVWLVLPFAVVAYVAMRAAEKIFGQQTVRAWLMERSRRLGGGIWERLSRLLVASSVLPFRVLFWFAIFAVWHSVISLLWTPKWRPWSRAWSKRWKPAKQSPPSPARSSTAGRPRIA